MYCRWCLAALMTVALAGCGTRTPELDYLPPSSPPASDRAAFVQQPSWLILGNILDHLQRQGVTVTDLDERAGEFSVEYTGDPEPYIDCGWIVTYQGDDLERIPAARSDASFRRKRDGRAIILERDMRLDARMKVKVEPDDEHAFVRADSVYELSKTIHSERPEQPRRSETINFSTGESAVFSSGTICQPNGTLERLVFESLPAVTVAGS